MVLYGNKFYQVTIYQVNGMEMDYNMGQLEFNKKIIA